MRIYFQILLWLACSAVATAQVAPNPGKTSASTLNGSTQANSATNAASTATVSVGGGYVLDNKHVLEPGDKISFQILEDRDPPKSLVVADSRELDVPFVGRVSVKDKTCKQLADELKIPLEAEYYKRATVIIGLDTLNKIRGKVYIIGQVRTQGAVELLFNENLTAGKAILRVGGFADFANKKKVRITRKSATGEGQSQIFEVNMADVLENGKADQDVVLEPDDLIYVPARLIN